jgi:hypothetical protein
VEAKPVACDDTRIARFLRSELTDEEERLFELHLDEMLDEATETTRRLMDLWVDSPESTK